MRVVFVTPVGVLGGGERSLLDLLAALPSARPGIDRHVIVCGDGPLIEAARALGATAEPLPMPRALASLGDSGLRDRGKLRAGLALAGRGLAGGWAVLRFLNTLRARLTALEPTVIHSNGIKAHLATSYAAPRGVPLVWHVRDYLGARPLVGKALRRRSHRARAAIAISQSVDRDVRDVLPALPTHVIYNAIDVDRFSPGAGNPEALDAAGGLPVPAPGTLGVGLIATYARWKGQDVFLEAVARLPRELNCRYHIIGGPLYQTAGSQFDRAELEALARRLGVADRVGFVPFQDDPASAFRALDIVVHASTRPEPFGRTIAEAMACGKAVLVSRAGGAAELFREGIDAIGIEPGSAESLAAKLAALIADPEARRRLGVNARAAAVERFSRDRLGREVAALYQSLI